MRDRASSGTTLHISTPQLSQNSDGTAYPPAISANGYFITYASAAENIVTGDGNSMVDVFLYGINSEQTTLISHAVDGTAVGASGETPSISADGDQVVFASSADGLFPDVPTSSQNIYLYHRVGDFLEVVSVDDAAVSATKTQPCHRFRRTG